MPHIEESRAPVSAFHRMRRQCKAPGNASHWIRPLICGRGLLLIRNLDSAAFQVDREHLEGSTFPQPFDHAIADAPGARENLYDGSGRR
jgi:hypothetical protein